jgi:hypothetical protein
VDGTGSGSCPMAGFGISRVEASGAATRKASTNYANASPCFLNNNNKWGCLSSTSVVMLLVNE